MQQVHTCISSSCYAASNLQSEVIKVNVFLCQHNVICQIKSDPLELLQGVPQGVCFWSSSVHTLYGTHRANT